MLPSVSPVTGHAVSKSGLGWVALAIGELVEFVELTELAGLVPPPHPVIKIEITVIVSKMPATNLSFFIGFNFRCNRIRVKQPFASGPASAKSIEARLETGRFSSDGWARVAQILLFSHKPISYMIVRLICLFWSVILGFFTVLWCMQIAHAFASKRWPTTQGVVVAFYATPEYKYSVGGRTYLSSQASWDGNILNSAKYALEYPLGAKVTVHYCARKPALAVLETKFDFSSGCIVAAALFLTTSLCMTGVIFGGHLLLLARTPFMLQQSQFR